MTRTLGNGHGITRAQLGKMGRDLVNVTLEQAQTPWWREETCFEGKMYNLPRDVTSPVKLACELADAAAPEEPPPPQKKGSSLKNMFGGSSSKK